MDDFYKLVRSDNHNFNLISIKDFYNIINLQNGDILLKNKIEEIILDFTKINILRIKEFEFSNSKIISCIINDKKIKTNYKPIYEHIYYIINDGTQIIKNTSLNIKTYRNDDDGWTYLNTLGISIQNVNSNKAIYEIINQCIINKINLFMKIELLNKNIINISF